MASDVRRPFAASIAVSKCGIMTSVDQSGPIGVGSEIVLDSLCDAVFTVDLQRRITYLNRSAENTLGTLRSQALGHPCATVFRSSLCKKGCALKEAIETGRPVTNRQAVLLNSSGRPVPVAVSTSLLRGQDGSIVGAVETFRDLRQLPAVSSPAQEVMASVQLVAASESMRDIMAMLPQVATTDTSLLIQGETGTGKEVLARTVHDLSPRRGKPFVAVNCAALPDTLLESELFGYKTGAFTGAVKDKPGRFAVAEGGTIFLDEIGDISPNLQVRLLRVLQHKEYAPLGDTRSVKANVRIITASNQDLAELVRQGLFRQDLFYRVNVLRLELPPLRQRREAIPSLADHFIRKFNAAQGRRISGLHRDALRALLAYDFPGNIRELENVIERAFVFCTGSTIMPQHLPDELRIIDIPAVRATTLNQAVRNTEAQALVRALSRNDFNREAAARELGMHKSTFFKKVKALGIILPEQDGRSSRKESARRPITRRSLKAV